MRQKGFWALPATHSKYGAIITPSSPTVATVTTDDDDAAADHDDGDRVTTTSAVVIVNLALIEYQAGQALYISIPYNVEQDEETEDYPRKSKIQIRFI